MTHDVSESPHTFPTRFREAVAVEETIETTINVAPGFAPAPISTKPDTVFVDEATRKEDGTPTAVVGLSNKAEKSNSKASQMYHQISSDTTCQWAVWNATRHKRSGLQSLPMRGVYMNVAIKTKEPKFHRFFVKADLAVAKEFFASIQVDWWLQRHAPPTRNRHACAGKFNLGCPAKGFCLDDRVMKHTYAFEWWEVPEVKERILEVAASYKWAPVPWEARDNGPSPHGMSRYGALRQCRMLHFFLYDLALTKGEGGMGSKGMQEGTAWHILMAGSARGRVWPDEAAAWVKLTQAARLEGRRIMHAYCRKYGADFVEPLSEEEIAEEFPPEDEGAEVGWNFTARRPGSK